MISYQPLYKTMKELNVSSYQLALRGFPRSTYYAMKKGKDVTTHTINQLCKILGCTVSDILEYIDED